MMSIRKILSSGLVWLWVAILVIAADQYSKMWVNDNLVLHEPLNIFPFFNLTLAYNTGAAFSFLHTASGWQNIFLGSLAFIVSVSILIYLYKLPARAGWTSIAVTLVLGGALGNAWDRIMYAHVIDFLDFHLGDWHFAIFNIADSAISVGAFMLLLAWVREKK